MDKSEKEYLERLLREREEELSVVNRCLAIIIPAVDVQKIYDSFIIELKKVVDINWASINLIEGSRLNILALYSEIDSAWEVGEQIPIRGTGTEWVALNKKALLESDLSQRGQFITAKYYREQGVRTIAYFPFIVKGIVIGSFVVATSNPNAYSQRHMSLLERLTSQIAMSIDNSRLYTEAEAKARTDYLTNLLNRRSLDELMALEINRYSRYGGVFSLLILDLDSFKTFNDNYGHGAGDELLKKISGVLRATIRSTDRAFRYGCDEFAILMLNTNIETAFKVAERIRKRIISQVKRSNINITASLGLGVWPLNGTDLNQVIQAANSALYQAKQIGGNKTCKPDERCY